MTELKLYKSTSKGLSFIVISLSFFVGGIWMIFESSLGSTNYIMGWFLAFFGGLGFLLGLFHSFDNRPQIIINVNGLWDRTTKQEEIKWEQIVNAYPLDLFGGKFICIVTDDTFVLKKRTYLWTSQVRKMIGTQDLNLNLIQINIEANKLTELIHELKNSEKKNRKIIIERFKFTPKKSPLVLISRVFIYVSISLALLLISLTGITAFMTILIITGLGVFTVRWYWGITKDSVIRKYAEKIAWLGFLNMIFLLGTLKSYEYVSERTGLKLSTQIDHFKKHHSNTPTDFNSIKANADLNFIEGVFANRIQYVYTEGDYELKIINLLNKERTYDKDAEKWK